MEAVEAEMVDAGERMMLRFVDRLEAADPRSVEGMVVGASREERVACLLGRARAGVVEARYAVLQGLLFRFGWERVGRKRWWLAAWETHGMRAFRILGRREFRVVWRRVGNEWRGMGLDGG